MIQFVVFRDLQACKCKEVISLNIFSVFAKLLYHMFFFFLSQSVEGEHHEKAVELLKAAQGTVKLVVRYTPKVLEEMESRFEKMRSAKRRQQNSYPQQGNLPVAHMSSLYLSLVLSIFFLTFFLPRDWTHTWHFFFLLFQTFLKLRYTSSLSTLFFTVLWK